MPDLRKVVSTADQMMDYAMQLKLKAAASIVQLFSADSKYRLVVNRQSFHASRAIHSNSIEFIQVVTAGSKQRSPRRIRLSPAQVLKYEVLEIT